jgi:DNA polymerase II small subunit
MLLGILKSHKQPNEIVRRFLEESSIQPQDTPVLTPEHLSPFIPIDTDSPQTKTGVHPLEKELAEKDSITSAREVEKEIHVVKDPTRELKSQGTIEDFFANFRDRYDRLKRIITQRVDGKGIISIQATKYEQTLSKETQDKTVKIVGMVSAKRTTQGGNLSFELEDPSGQTSVIVLKKDTALMNKATLILLDQIVCVEGRPVNNEMIIATDMFLPDIPLTERTNHADEDICVALISDIHFGSKQFIESAFRRFIDWLNGLEDLEKDLAQSVKYVVIAGDLVDGIGVYPKQHDDINIYNLDDQFKGLAGILKEIPEYIHVILTPGNHDGVRTAIPRPAIEERFIEPLVNQGLSVTSLGCPCQFSLHGVSLLVYHGDSLIDMMGALPTQGLDASFEAMREMIRGRHLAPTYGKETPIAVEPRDWLVIERVPDILHCGHTHVNCIGKYRKTMIVNSGTFQNQTDYQRSIGIIPTPGIVPIVNLRTLNVKQLKFI